MIKTIIKKNYFWNTIGSMQYSINSFLFLIIVTRINGLEMAGYYSLGYIISTIFFTIASYGGRNYQITDSKEEFSDIDYVFSRFFVSIITIVIGILFSLMYIDNIIKFLVVLLLIIEKCVEAFSDVFYGIMQKKGKLFLVGQSMFIKSIISLLFFVIIEIFFKNLIISLIFYVVINLINLILFDIKKSNFKRENNKSIKFNNMIIKKCFPYFILAFLINYVYNIPRTIMDKMLDSSFQGIFGIIVVPISVLLIFIQFFIQPKIVEITKKYKENYNQFLKEVNQIIIVTIAMSLLSLIFIKIFGITFLNYVYKINLINYEKEIIICYIGGIFYSLVFVLYNPLTIMRKGKGQIIIYLISGLLSILFSIILIKTYGFIGAVISYCITMVLLGTLYFIYYKKQLIKIQRN